MNSAQKQLTDGAIKSAVKAFTGLIIALPLMDPMKFSIASLGGWGRILTALLIVTVVAEAGYWNQWASSPTANPKVPATPATVITEKTTTTIQPPSPGVQ
jgi:hypothetical protein